MFMMDSFLWLPLEAGATKAVFSCFQEYIICYLVVYSARSVPQKGKITQQNLFLKIISLLLFGGQLRFAV
jgi:hypothetical protein